MMNVSEWAIKQMKLRVYSVFGVYQKQDIHLA